MKKFSHAFTLLEIVIALIIIGVLAMMAIPDLSIMAVRAQLKESAPLIDVAKAAVTRYYLYNGKMPANNTDAGLPEAAKLVGKYVTGIDVRAGAVTITWGNSVNSSLRDKKLTIRPAFVEDQPVIPIAWICASATVPKGMKIEGIDATDFPAKFIPLECRPRADEK